MHDYKHTLWLACSEKRCCSLRTVLPSGAEIYRIASSLDVPPVSFLRALPARPGEQHAFALDTTQRRYHAALVREAQKGGAARCVFLLHPAEHVARCGLGDLRPLPCQAFPSALQAGLLVAHDEGMCSCRSWSLGDLDIGRERALLAQYAAECARYQALIAAWNTSLLARRALQPVLFADFCSHLMEVYASDVDQRAE